MLLGNTPRPAHSQRRRTMPEPTLEERKIAKVIDGLIALGLSPDDARRVAPDLAELVPDSRAASPETILARKTATGEYNRM